MNLKRRTGYGLANVKGHAMRCNIFLVLISLMLDPGLSKSQDVLVITQDDASAGEKLVQSLAEGNQADDLLGQSMRKRLRIAIELSRNVEVGYRNGTRKFDEVTSFSQRVVNDALPLAVNSADRISMLKYAVHLARQRQAYMKAAIEVGTATMESMLEAEHAMLTAEVRLLRELASLEKQE